VDFVRSFVRWLVGWLAGWLVGWLVGWSVGRLVGWSVGWSVGTQKERRYSRTSHFEWLHNLYFSTNIVRVIKSRTEWAGQVARMVEMGSACRILVGNPEGRR
jgi:hypothetical protein